MCDLENPQTLKNSGCTALKPDTAKIFIRKNRLPSQAAGTVLIFVKK